MSDVVKSDKSYLTSYTSNMSSILGSSNDATTGGLGYSSTSSCPSREPSVVDAVFLNCNELYRRISKDIDNINAVADSIETLDNSMKNYTNKLGMDVKSTKSPIVEISKTGDSLKIENNDSIRSQINKLVEEKGGDFKLKDRTKNTSSSNGSRGGFYNNGSSPTITELSSIGGVTPTSNYSNNTITGNTTSLLGDISSPIKSVTSSNKKEDNIVDFDNTIDTSSFGKNVMSGATTRLGSNISGERLNQFVNQTVNTPSNNDDYRNLSTKDFVDNTIQEEENTINELEGKDEPSVEVLNNQIENIIPDIINIEEEKTLVATKANTNNNLVAGIAGIAAAGAVIGAGAYAANKISKEKDEDEEDTDDFYKEEGDNA